MTEDSAITKPKKHRRGWKALLFLAVILALGAWWATGNKSEGFQTGTIIRCGVDGNIPGCRTHECEMLAGGGVGAASTPGAANVWTFTVPDSEWDTGIGQTMDLAPGHVVKATYERPRFTNPCRTKSGFYVTKVEILGLTVPVDTNPQSTKM